MSKILIVDDEKDFVQMVIRILDKEGYEVSYAYRGEDGLEKIKNEKPDLVILDVMMPDLDGFSVCEKIRGDREWETLPIIFLSVKKADQDILTGLTKGGTDYLTKPFNTEILLKKIEKLLTMREMELLLKANSRELQKDLDEKTGELKEAQKKIQDDYWKVAKELKVTKSQMEHDEVKVSYVGLLVGLLTLAMIMSLVILITTGSVLYLEVLLGGGVVAAVAITAYYRNRMSSISKRIEEEMEDVESKAR